MQSFFDTNKANQYINDPLAMRVYTSRLLGSSGDLVLHGGGNTSVKIDNFLYVKGSGWDLATIEKEGFSAVDLNTLNKMATRDKLSDTQMVYEQKEAMLDKNAPNPSIEAILHAIIPFTFVDHTHADAVVTITNTRKGKQLIQDIYGENMLIIDYVMPGFLLAKEIYEQTKNINWQTLEGIILLNHGVFTFADDAQASYEKMIHIVTMAEEYLKEKTQLTFDGDQPQPIALESFSDPISILRGKKIYPHSINTPQAYHFSKLENLAYIIHNGPLTPEHVIRTKSFPLLIKNNFEDDLETFITAYKTYFKNYAQKETMLDLAPRWAVIQGQGIVVFGSDEKENHILSDIITHTINAILKAEQLGGWQSLCKEDIFAIEYWELEQAKLR